MEGKDMRTSITIHELKQQRVKDINKVILSVYATNFCDYWVMGASEANAFFKALNEASKSEERTLGEWEHNYIHNELD